MPSLFNRRSRSVSTSRPIPPASSSAHVAAAQAFLANQQSHGNLSSAAAAAALRSMSPTPTPVNQVQTKRMMNRQSSVSSVGSATRGRSRGGLQRQHSNGSMTERTFRSPSPGQPNLPEASSRVKAPPVPPVPQRFATEDVPPIPKKSHRRSMSLETPVSRVASPPPVRRPMGQGQKVNQSLPQGVSAAAALAARRSASLQQNDELERSDSRDSRNSFNFSYPRGTRPNSPPPTKAVAVERDASMPEKSAQGGITSVEAASIQSSMNKTAAKPVKKKKKIVNHNNGEGSYLQSGSVASAVDGEPVGSRPVVEKAAGETTAEKKPRKKAALTGENSHFPDNIEGDQPENAETAPVSTDKTTAKRASRAAGVLQKQPSVVREDWEGEQEEMASSPSSPVSPTFEARAVAGPSGSVQSRKPLTAANMSRKMEDSSKPMVHNVVTTPVSKAVESVKALSTDGKSPRGTSISPSRSFRFSDRLASDMTAGRKHEPLPRSVSPAKSALKHHSPAAADASPGNQVPAQRRGSSVTPSETSEVSVDGLPKRKKSVRMSFDAESEADAAAEAEPTIRGQKASNKKGIFGFGKSKSALSDAVDADAEAEEGMKPRPALPLFGSVRKPRPNDVSPSPTSRRHDESTVSSPRSPALSDFSSHAGVSTMQTSVSSDHALGGILYHQSQREAVPQPPEVRSVEGTGYASDTDSLSSDDADGQHSSAAGAGLHYSDTGNVGGDGIKDHAVPVIAVQPATPGLNDSIRDGEWSEDVPGGFPASSTSSGRSSSEVAPPSAKTDATEGKSTGLGVETDSALYETQQSSSTQSLNTIPEEGSTDNDSIYSDAAEDLSDLEGDGFGSINAIIDSPLVAASPATHYADQPDSPVVAVDESRKEAPRTASWDNAQAHWSGLAKQTRDNFEKKQSPAESMNPELEESVRGNPPVQGQDQVTPSLEPSANILSKPKKKPMVKKQKQNASAPSSTVPLATPPYVKKDRAQPDSPETPQSQPFAGATTATKRLSTATKQNGFRHSMRSEPDSAPVTTLRQRPQSMVTTPTQPRGILQKKQVASAMASKPLQRTFSNDSDSDSSFKKARRNRKNANGGFGMRTSMRGPAPEERLPAARERARDVRSLSPVNRRPTSSMGGNMRMTMRGSQDRAAPTLRGQSEQKRSSSLFGKSRKAMSPTRPSSFFGGMTKSRLADSDDEDGPRPTTYRSRFADSSDDEPEPLRPVRGIPRKRDDADSTDLEDSSDDQRRKQKPAPKPSTPKKLAIQVPETSSPAVSEPMSPTTAKKRGFWGRLRGKKDTGKESSASPIIAQPNDKDTEEINTANGETNASGLGFNSTAERDALVEETMRKLEAAQDSPASPGPGKLQRRVTPQRVLSDSWPLPPKMPAAADKRPITSDGVGASARPGMGERQPTSETVRTAGGTAVYGRSGKKKKFPFLRKAFGLTD